MQLNYLTFAMNFNLFINKNLPNLDQLDILEKAKLTKRNGTKLGKYF